MREILGVGMKIKPGKCWARNDKGLRGVFTLDGIWFPHVAYACKSFGMQGVFRGREKSLEKAASLSLPCYWRSFSGGPFFTISFFDKFLFSRYLLRRPFTALL